LDVWMKEYNNSLRLRNKFGIAISQGILIVCHTNLVKHPIITCL